MPKVKNTANHVRIFTLPAQATSVSIVSQIRALGKFATLRAVQIVITPSGNATLIDARTNYGGTKSLQAGVEYPIPASDALNLNMTSDADVTVEVYTDEDPND